MKFLSSVVEGFTVLLGTPVIHFACFVTLLLVIRKPPEYKEGYTQGKDADGNPIEVTAR